jgi:hypothetical protein
MTQKLFSGAWGKMIHEKIEAKNLVPLSLKEYMGRQRHTCSRISN